MRSKEKKGERARELERERIEKVHRTKIQTYLILKPSWLIDLS